MFAQAVTSSRQAVCQQFFQIFTVPTADIFTPLVCGWILCTARRTVTGIVRFAELFIDRPHYAFHRFFSCAIWSVAELWRLLAVILIKTFYPRGVIREGPERAAAMSFWLYSIVWLWYLDNKRPWKMLPRLAWYHQKRTPSFADALACLRQTLWKERINCMFDKHIAFEKIPKPVITALSCAA